MREHLGSFYRGGKTLVAEYAKLVFEAAKAGDTVANGILGTQAEGVCRQLATAIERFDCSSAVNVVLCGGIATHNPGFISMLSDELKPAYPNINVKVCHTAPVYGALHLAGLTEDQL